MISNIIQKTIDKYIPKFKLNKQEFQTFVKTKVRFSNNQCKQFLNIIDQELQDQFDKDKLRQLLHLISAFQAGEDISNIDEQQLNRYTSLKFKKKNQPGQNNEPVQKNIQKNQNTKISQSQNSKLSNKNTQKVTDTSKKQISSSANAKLNNNQTINNNKSKDKQKQLNKQQIKLNIQQIDDDEQIQIQVKVPKVTKNKQTQYRQISSQDQKQTKKVPQKVNNKKNQKVQLKSGKNNKQQIQNSYQYQDQKKYTESMQPSKQIIKKGSTGSKQKIVQKLDTINQEKSQQLNISQSKSYKYNSDGNKSGSTQVYPKLDMVECDNSKQLVNIIKFEKTGQDFMNPIIKYQIIYKTKSTWRRYSEIQKLLTYLRFKYEGIVLPQMPPKQGIKGNLNYFWKSGVNEQFLDQRKQKLKQVLNRVLACQYVNKDQILEKFLTDQDFQLSNTQGTSQSYLQTLYGLKDIVFNYNQLKDYGVAYYNYVSQYKNKTINTECSQLYTQLQGSMNSIFAINQYRLSINQNFQKRRQIMYDSKVKTKQPIKLKLDIVLEEAQVECHELNLEYCRYQQLKSTEGWEKQLIKQKQAQGGQALTKIKQNHTKTLERIAKTEQNLIISIKRLLSKNKVRLDAIGQQLIQWRKKIHP